MSNIELYKQELPVIGGFFYDSKKEGQKGERVLCFKYVGKLKNKDTGYWEDSIFQKHILLTKLQNDIYFKGKDEKEILSSLSNLKLVVDTYLFDMKK